MVDGAIGRRHNGQPDPDTAQTSVDFVEAMRRLKSWAGLGYRRLERRAETEGDVLPRSTLTAALARTTLPREDIVAPFVRACGCGELEVQRWVAARRRIAAGASPKQTKTDVANAVPAQLPASLTNFVGRMRVVEDLIARLTSDDRKIVVITGGAGAGKTSLAVHVANHVADQFPDGQLYVNLRGFDPDGASMEPAVAVRGFLDALDVPPSRFPSEFDAMAALYRSRLAGKKLLVVLDNARDAEHVRPLLPRVLTCRTIVTSRNDLTGLVATEDAHVVTVGQMSTLEARELLARRLAPSRLTADPSAVDEIVESCARLPLALAIAAARVAARPELDLTDVAVELRDAEVETLDSFDTGDPAADARAVFFWSYRCLGSEAARLFRLLGLHPGPVISVAAAASLAGTTSGKVRRLLAELTRLHLLDRQPPGRYAFHDLLRAYALESACKVDTEVERAAATHRVLDYYLHTAQAADRQLNPVRDQRLLAPAGQARPTRDPVALSPAQPEVAIAEFLDRASALAWLTTERHTLSAAIRLAGDAGFDEHTWQLAWSVSTFLFIQSYCDDHVNALEAALVAARRRNDLPVQAHIHRDLGKAHGRMGAYDAAHKHYWLGLVLAREVGDEAGQAHAHLGLSHVESKRRDHAAAFDHAQQALEQYRAARHRRGEAMALNNIGWGHCGLGEYEECRIRCEEALAIQRELGDLPALAVTWHSLGYAHHHLARFDDAITCYQTAVDQFRQLGDVYNTGATLTHLGDTFYAAGQREAAHDAWQEALLILNKLGHPDANEVRARLGPPLSHGANSPL